MKPKRFKPKRGQVDYRHIHWAPVINCVLKCGDKILLVHRNKNMNLYPGYWSGISGFLDDDKSLEEKVAEEVKEELGIDKKKIVKIKLGEIFDQEDPANKKTWIVHPVFVEIKPGEIKLNWEAEGYRWIKPREAQKLKLIPNFDKVLEKLSQWL